MKINPFAQLSAVVLMLLLITATTNCTKDSSIQDELKDLEADSVLQAIVNDTLCKEFYLNLKELPYLIQVEPTNGKENIGAPVIETTSTQICTTQQVKWSAEYDELNLLDPKNEVIYPSAPIDATSVKTGAYTPLSNIQRGPATISISLLTQPGTKPYRVVEEPSLSSIRDAINELLHDASPGSTPAFVNFSIEEIRAQKELDVAVQANFKGFGASVASSFNFSSSTVKSRFLLKFYQKYYTIDVDLPNTPCDYFKPGQLPEISQFNGTSPVYVSSVTYGRMVYFMIESSSSAEAMKTALNVSVKKWGMGAGLDLNYSQKQMIEQSQISALIVGGNADSAVKAVSGLQGLIDFITEDGDFSPTSPGVPIAYTMRYLKDNSVSNIVLSSEYTIRNCTDIPATTVTFTPDPITEVRLNHVSGDTEFDGHGPLVMYSCTLGFNENEIRAIVKVNMKETAYTTEGDITYEKILWTCPPGQKIIGINSAKYHQFNYIDTDDAMDTFDFPLSDLVKRLEFKGDTGGGDLAQSEIEQEGHLHLLKFNPISIVTKPE